jgi:hypothetical protein
MLELELDKEYIATFIHPDTEEKFTGRIFYKKGEIIGDYFSLPKAASLEPSHPFLSSNYSDHFKYLYLMLYDGQKHHNGYLIDCYLTKYSTTKFAYTVDDSFNGSFRAKGLLIGNSIVDFNSLKFDRISLADPSLYYWFTNKNLNFNFTLEGNNSVNWKKFHEVELYESDQFKVLYRSNLTEKFSRSKSTFNLITDSFVSYEFKSAQPYQQVNEYVEDLRRLFSLFFFAPIGNNPIYLKSGSDYFEYYKSDSRSFSKNLNTFEHLPFSMAELDQIKPVINNWFSKDEDFINRTAAYFELDTNRNTYTHISFQVLVNTLERFTNFEKPIVSTSRKKRELIEYFEALQPEKNKINQLRAFLTKSSYSKLKHKLSLILESYKFIDSLLGEPIEDFVDKIVATRHWYTHPTEIKKENIISDKDLFGYKQTLSKIIYGIILIELGMNEDFFIIRMEIQKQFGKW